MNKIEEVVDNLNERLYGKDAQHEFNFSHGFSSIHAPYWNAIVLYLNYEDYDIEIKIWDSEHESRKWNEKTQNYEDLEKHIIQKYKNVLKDMSKLTKYLCK